MENLRSSRLKAISLNLDNPVHARHFCETTILEMHYCRVQVPVYDFKKFSDREWKILAQSLMNDFVLELQRKNATIH